jgi:hypothetical protein
MLHMAVRTAAAADVRAPIGISYARTEEELASQGG